MKKKFFIFSLLIFFTLLVSLAQKNDSAKIPFQYNKNDFGNVVLKVKSKITSKDESVKSGFPDDLPTHNLYFLEDKRPLLSLEKGGRYFFAQNSFICLIPTTDSSESNFAKSYPNFNNAISKLRQTLKNKPKKLKQTFDETEGIFDIPYNNAGWSFISKTEYIDSLNIEGVFFLTQYGNDMLPSLANNEELTATFQGLTKDGKFYVSARFAITHPELPKGIDFTDKTLEKQAMLLNIEEMNKFWSR
jgi:hypothetical protein